MFECALREFHEYDTIVASSVKRKKKGFYSDCVLPIRGLGREKWAVIVHININYEKHLSEGFSKEQIIQECIDFLNQSPPRKKYAKKKTKPLYGYLTPYRAKFKEDEQGQFIEAEITTDERKNKNFWREGSKYRKYRMPSKMRSK
tara:strand:+ start:4376 stop:4810 length:435 start_codon:yes stop_codon:yes gene_type:complete